MEKSIKRNWIIAICLTCFFSVFAGYYLCYSVNTKEKSKIEIIQDIMENEWYYGIEDEDIHNTLETKMILAMENPSKDPYTRYLTSLGSLSDSYTGIGVSIRSYGKYQIIVEVNSIYAIESGLESNDIIVSIDDVDISNKNIDQLGELLKDKRTVKIGVIKNKGKASSEIVNYNIEIKSYNPISVFTKEYLDNISYVRISEFNMDTASLLKTYFNNLDPKYTDLILDLRGNPGGYINAVRDVLDVFVGANKTVLVTKDKKGRETYVKTFNDNDDVTFDDIYVLIDSLSASGAEALSAAMDYYLPNVTLYGDTTFGKGSAQKTYYFDDGTYFHYTYAEWFTPSGKKINHVGVSPEVIDINKGISSIDLYTKNYKLDDYGEGVKSVQEILTKLGYYSGRIHSFMDEATVESLKKFQTDKSISVTGEIDDGTLRELSKEVYDDECDFKNNQLYRVINLIKG